MKRDTTWVLLLRQYYYYYSITALTQDVRGFQYIEACGPFTRSPNFEPYDVLAVILQPVVTLCQLHIETTELSGPNIALAFITAAMPQNSGQPRRSARSCNRRPSAVPKRVATLPCLTFVGDKRITMWWLQQLLTQPSAVIVAVPLRGQELETRTWVTKGAWDLPGKKKAQEG